MQLIDRMNTQHLKTSHSNLSALRPTLPPDEIDLALLIRNIVHQWKLILLITTLVTALGIGYAVMQPSVYQIEATLAAPTIADLGRMTEQDLLEITPKVALDRAVQTLLSPKKQSEVFKQSELAAKLSKDSDLSTDQLFLNLHSNLNIDRIDHDVFVNQELADDLRKEIHLTLESTYPAEATAFVRSLIDNALSQTVEDIQVDVSVKRAEGIQSLQEELNALTTSVKASREAEIARMEESNAQKIKQLELNMRLMETEAREKRLNRIDVLKEALKTAQTLNITEPVVWISDSPNQNNALTPMALNWMKENYPEFYRGTKHLNAEINMLQERENDLIYLDDYTETKAQIAQIKSDPELAALKSRKNDTIYIPNYNELRTQIANIQRQPSDFPNAIVANIIQPAIVPSQPFKPNHKLIAVAGAVLGAFLALFIALVRLAMTPADDRKYWNT